MNQQPRGTNQRGRGGIGRGRGRGAGGPSATGTASAVQATRAPQMACKKSGDYWVACEFPREIMELLGKKIVLRGGQEFTPTAVRSEFSLDTGALALMFYDAGADLTAPVNIVLAAQEAVKDVAFLAKERATLAERVRERNVEGLDPALPETFGSRGELATWIAAQSRERRQLLTMSKDRFRAAAAAQQPQVEGVPQPAGPPAEEAGAQIVD